MPAIISNNFSSGLQETGQARGRQVCDLQHYHKFVIYLVFSLNQQGMKPEVKRLFHEL